MNFEKNENYTKELVTVLNYMTDILVNEFPTDVFTPEYLMVSILDNKDCKAYRLLDDCLMSDNMQELKEAYINVIKEHIKLNTDETNFSDDLVKILNAAKDEQNYTNSSKIGTLQVLLSILNPKNEIGIRDVFNAVGIEYNLVIDRVTSKPILNPYDKKSIAPKNLNNNIIKPTIFTTKSTVNATNIIENTENIDKYTVNLNKLAKEGKIDDLVGRKAELSKIVKVLARRKKNNVILVGEGGVGKTVIVEGLAKLITEGKVPSILEGKEIVKIDIMEMVSGTNFRGMFEQRVKGLFNELKSSNKYILFIDDIQNVLKSGSKEKDTDISGMIGDLLEGGEVRVIATTTFKDYRNSIEINSSIERKFQKIIVDAPTNDETYKILMDSKKYYEDFHNVKYSSEAIKKSIELAKRYITEKSLPDSAFDIIDLAGAATNVNKETSEEFKNLQKRLEVINEQKEEALNAGEFEKIDEIDEEENEINKNLNELKREERQHIKEINVDDIAAIVSEMTKIPINKLSENEKKKLAHIDSVIKKSVIGQNEAIEDVCRVVKRNKVGLGNKNRCQGTFLFVGPTACGKTLIAKQLAKEVFGSENALVRIDMSEYSEKNSVAKLTGAAPGYIGYDNGGQLTEAVKNKQYCVLLLDEIEKADKEVFNVFLQLFDEGRLTDSSGHLVSFKNVIVIMTSNVGARQVSELGNGMGFNIDEKANSNAIIEKSLKRTFTPEFLNRIDKIVYFNNLTDDNLKEIVKLEVKKLDDSLNDLHYHLHCDDSVIDYLQVKAIEQKKFGARPIIRLVQSNIEDVITDLILEHDYTPEYEFSATCVNNSINVK